MNKKAVSEATDGAARDSMMTSIEDATFVAAKNLVEAGTWIFIRLMMDRVSPDLRNAADRATRAASFDCGPKETP